MPELQQHTLAGPAIFAGVGLHSGAHVRAAIRPAPQDSGVVFVRTDLAGQNRVPAFGDNVVNTRLNTVIGRQRVELAVNEESFRRELSDCRTFGFLSDVEALRRAGLALGGSLDNAVVVDGDRILNPEGLRRPDEFVRHKALDAVGDLYLLGCPLLGRFEGIRAGHAVNNALVRELLSRPTAWRWRTDLPALAEAV